MARNCHVEQLRQQTRGLVGERLRDAVDAWAREARYLPRILAGWRGWMGRTPDWLVPPGNRKRQEVDDEISHG